MSPEDLSKLSIEVLAQRAREGDKDAWAELLRRYEPQLKAWAARHVHPSTPGGIRPSDVTQEAALKAFSRFSSVKGSSGGELWKWFEEILGNTLVDMVRHATRQKRGEGETFSLDASEVQDLPALQHTPSQLSAQREQGRHLLEGFLHLKPEQRDALSLYLLRGSSREELMTRLGHSRDALDSLLRRAMHSLDAFMTGRAQVESQDPRESLLRNQLDAALSLYFRRLEEGVPVDPETFAADFPECADKLRGLLRLLEELRALHPPT